MIAKFTIMERTLSKELLAVTEVGNYVLTDKRGVPFLKLNHLHCDETPVKAYVRKAYDSIKIERL